MCRALVERASLTVTACQRMIQRERLCTSHLVIKGTHVFVEDLENTDEKITSLVHTHAHSRSYNTAILLCVLNFFFICTVSLETLKKKKARKKC